MIEKQIAIILNFILSQKITVFGFDYFNEVNLLNTFSQVELRVAVRFPKGYSIQDLYDLFKSYGKDLSVNNINIEFNDSGFYRQSNYLCITFDLVPLEYLERLSGLQRILGIWRINSFSEDMVKTGPNSYAAKIF